MFRSIATLSAALLLTSAAFAQDAPGATATFLDAQGAEVGTVNLTAMDGGIHVSGTVGGIPAGTHGIHFHETGNCDPSAQFESAGGHFNPDAKKHGLENPEGPHAGDLPNAEAGADMNLPVEIHSTSVSLDEAAPGYVFDGDGTALVIHASEDDQKTDPSGNSGERIACAVIEAAQ